MWPLISISLAFSGSKYSTLPTLYGWLYRTKPCSRDTGSYDSSISNQCVVVDEKMVATRIYFTLHATKEFIERKKVLRRYMHPKTEGSYH